MDDSGHYARNLETFRQMIDAKAVDCPSCPAKAGTPCTWPGQRTDVHDTRRTKALMERIRQ